PLPSVSPYSTLSRSPHARKRFSHRRDGHAARGGLVLEGAVLLVHPQAVGLAVVGDEDVGPAVAVGVGADDAESRRRHEADGGCDVGRAYVRTSVTVS